jgi:rhodanese-related sulfurtransferase
MRQAIPSLLLAALTLLATPARAADPAPGIVDAPTARKLVSAGVKVVDVRTAGEFAAGHLPGAVNIPYDEIERRLGEVGPPGAPVLIYCRSGRRSGIAAQRLEARGYTRVYDLQAYDRWAGR